MVTNTSIDRRIPGLPLAVAAGPLLDRLRWMNGVARWTWLRSK